MLCININIKIQIITNVKIANMLSTTDSAHNTKSKLVSITTEQGNCNRATMFATDMPFCTIHKGHVRGLHFSANCTSHVDYVVIH